MRNLYTPAVMRKIFDAASATGLQEVDEIDMVERNAIELYCEYNTATSLKVVVWVRLRVEHPDGEKTDVWAALPEVTIPKVTESSHPSGTPLVGTTRSAPTVISVPNCYAAKLELTTITASGDVTIWAAPIEKAPAIA